MLPFVIAWREVFLSNYVFCLSFGVRREILVHFTWPCNVSWQVRLWRFSILHKFMFTNAYKCATYLGFKACLNAFCTGISSDLSFKHDLLFMEYQPF